MISQFMSGRYWKLDFIYSNCQGHKWVRDQECLENQHKSSTTAFISKWSYAYLQGYMMSYLGVCKNT